MERVPTWAGSPYLGMFQYKNAGPDRIHHKSVLPFFLPASPYLGALRHDQLRLARPKTVSVGTQTSICLSAFVIRDYKTKP